MNEYDENNFKNNENSKNNDKIDKDLKNNDEIDKNLKNKRLKDIKALLYGLSIADSLGVPVEFLSRDIIRKNPVTDMIGYGTYNLPPGSFSDDSSLSFATVESLINGYNLEEIAENFKKWLFESWWTPFDKTFDVGNTTAMSIEKMADGMQIELCGGIGEHDNGNGSLMRIAPLIFFIEDMNLEKRFKIVKEVSSLTHRHFRSIISCFYYIEYLLGLLEGKNKFEIYEELQTKFYKELSYLIDNEEEYNEINHLKRILDDDIYEFDEDEIRSGGYVISSLEASLWCFLNSNSYSEAVLKAINLGEDTDTVGAITGAIAGIYYGFDDIPDKWIKGIVKSKKIDDLAVRYFKSLE
ncbi:MAG: ADP-ribosylglycohydrolase family protein [Methanobrevibacter sp.]|jgi:ADP-ribosylglycohydrolase|nr:ADP-ribosylglycohydrolase family protein [Candidatus Methanoflexus mossambicus]